MSYKGWGTNRFHATMGTTYGPVLTISCWIKKDATQWANGSADYAWTFNYASNSDDNAFRLYTGTDTMTIAARTTSTESENVSFTDGTYDDIWVPVIFQGNASNDRYGYIENSTNQSTQGLDTKNLTALDEFRVGRIMVGVGAFEGKIAEIAIWNKALSSTEIDQLCPVLGAGPKATAIASAKANLIAYWPLDYESTTQVDESGNGESSLVEGGSGSNLVYDADHPIIYKASSAVGRGIAGGVLRGVG